VDAEENDEYLLLKEIVDHRKDEMAAKADEAL